MKLLCFVFLIFADSSLGQFIPQTNGTGLPDTNPLGSMVKIIGSFTDSLSRLQNILTEVNSQMSNMLKSGTRMVSGLEADNIEMGPSSTTTATNTATSTTTAAPSIPGFPDSGSIPGGNFGETFLKGFNSFFKQIGPFSKTLEKLNQQMRDIIHTTSRLLGGSKKNHPLDKTLKMRGKRQLENVGNPMLALNKVISTFTEQLTSLSSQLTKMIGVGGGNGGSTNQGDKNSSSANRGPSGNPIEEFSKMVNNLANGLKNIIPAMNG